MNKIKFHSLEQQDEFVVNVLNHKRNGIFLDVACGHPYGGNNTYTLEKQYDWTGFCFDIYDCESIHNWSSHRTSDFVRMDATTEAMTNFLKAKFEHGTVIDYVSLDIDGDSIAALRRIVDSGVKIATITFEHEVTGRGEEPHRLSREILEDLGMVRLFEDLDHPLRFTGDSPDPYYFEDWWIHPSYVDSSVLEIKTGKKIYKDCMNSLKKFKNANYESTHACCLAYPEEYEIWGSEQERIRYQYEFDRNYGTDWRKLVKI